MRVTAPLYKWISVQSPTGYLLGKVHDAVVKVENRLPNLSRLKPVCSKCGGSLDAKPTIASDSLNTWGYSMVSWNANDFPFPTRDSSNRIPRKMKPLRGQPKLVYSRSS